MKKTFPEPNMTEENINDNEIKIINTACCHNCGGWCVLKTHIKNGRIIRFETDHYEEPQLRACLRGRAYRQRVYSDVRFKYPLRRTGERGEGKFERISWEEALDLVTEKLKFVKEKYNNSAILFVAGSGKQLFFSYIFNLIFIFFILARYAALSATKRANS